jgi:hypothetical protein
MILLKTRVFHVFTMCVLKCVPVYLNVILCMLDLCENWLKTCFYIQNVKVICVWMASQWTFDMCAQKWYFCVFLYFFEMFRKNLPWGFQACTFFDNVFKNTNSFRKRPFLCVISMKKAMPISSWCFATKSFHFVKNVYTFCLISFPAFQKSNQISINSKIHFQWEKMMVQSRSKELFEVENPIWEIKKFPIYKKYLKFSIKL